MARKNKKNFFPGQLVYAIDPECAAELLYLDMQHIKFSAATVQAEPAVLIESENPLTLLHGLRAMDTADTVNCWTILLNGELIKRVPEFAIYKHPKLTSLRESFRHWRANLKRPTSQQRQEADWGTAPNRYYKKKSYVRKNKHLSTLRVEFTSGSSA